MATTDSRFNGDIPQVKKVAPEVAASTPGTWAARRIGANGVILIAWQQISVAKHRAGQNVDVLINDSMVKIGHQDILLKTALRTNNKEVRKKECLPKRSRLPN